MEPSPDDGELELVGIYPNVVVEDVKQKVGWPLRVRAKLEAIPPPTSEELHLLRDVLDPDRLFL